MHWKCWQRRPTVREGASKERLKHTAHIEVPVGFHAVSYTGEVIITNKTGKW